MEKEKEISGWVSTILWLSIIMGGTHNIIDSITAIMLFPLLGIISLASSIIDIIGLLGILYLKKWGFILWVINGIVMTVVVREIAEDGLLLTYLTINCIKIILLCLLLQIRKNGVSAWSLLFSKKKKEEQPAVQQPPQPPFPMEQNNTADNHLNDRMAVKDNTDNEWQRTVDFVKANEVHVYSDNEKEERQAVPETNVTTEELRTEMPADSPLQMKKKCMNCGKELPADALFCNRCGCKIEPKEECTTEELKPQPVSVEADNAKENIAVKEEIKTEENIPEEKPKKKRNWALLFVLLGVLAIFLGIKVIAIHMKKESNALIEEYARQRYGLKEKNLLDKSEVSSTGSKEWNSIFDKNDTSSEEDETRKIMEEAVEECNKGLPQEIGFGITLNSCKLEGRNMIYSYEWVGMKPSDFTTDVINDLKASMIEGLQEESFDTNMARTLVVEYNYRYTFRYYGKDGNRLCEISITSDDLKAK